METHRNGFMPYFNQPHYSPCHPRIPPPHPSEIIVPRDLVPVNRSPIRHMAGSMNPQCINSNIGQGPQPVVSIVPPMYNPAPRLAAPIASHMVPQAYYTYPTRPVHFPNSRYEPSPVNRNSNPSPKNFVSDHQPPRETPAPVQSRWIKPTIFYDGFWTEQKVKKWISEQFIEESSLASSVDKKARHINRAH